MPWDGMHVHPCVHGCACAHPNEIQPSPNAGNLNGVKKAREQDPFKTVGENTHPAYSQPPEAHLTLHPVQQGKANAVSSQLMWQLRVNGGEHSSHLKAIALTHLFPECESLWTLLTLPSPASQDLLPVT